MKIIAVKTGFGFYRDKNDKIVAKARLPIGNHPMSDDFTYVEVADEAALAAIQFDIDPAEQLRRQNENLIASKTRELSIAALKTEGKLPGDFVDAVIS